MYEQYGRLPHILELTFDKQSVCSSVLDRRLPRILELILINKAYVP